MTVAKHRHASERTAFEYTKPDQTLVTLQVCKCGLARWIEADPQETRPHRGPWESTEEMSADLATSISKIIHTHDGTNPGARELVWELAVFMTAADDETDRHMRGAA